ncbi:MAG: cytochrome P450, partial [Deltaproteobacteria bacterium]|nr:cytochrome P450 [Deltaproteobacteria bacterium]
MPRLFDPAVLREDPYPIYARLREKTPIVRVPLAEKEAWLVSRYDDCVQALRDPGLELAAVRGWVPPELGEGPAARILPRLLAVQDPREPNRIRALISDAFTVRAIEGLRSTAQEGVNQALDRAQAKGAMDLVEDFALPVAFLSVAALLAVPAEDCALLHAWAPQAEGMFEPGALGPGGADRCHTASEELWAWFEDHVRRQRRRPGDDLMAALIRVRHGEQSLSDDELVAFCVHLVTIGCRIGEALIGSGGLALALHRKQAERLRWDPSLAVAVVEECLRWDSPVQMAVRVAVRDTSLRGFAIERGQSVYILLGSANRDPELFE